MQCLTGICSQKYRVMWLPLSCGVFSGVLCIMLKPERLLENDALLCAFRRGWESWVPNLRWYLGSAHHLGSQKGFWCGCNTYFTNLEAPACRQSSAGRSSCKSGSAPEVAGDQTGARLPCLAPGPDMLQVAKVPRGAATGPATGGLPQTQPVWGRGVCPRGMACPGSGKPAGQRPSDEVSALI